MQQVRLCQNAKILLYVFGARFTFCKMVVGSGLPPKPQEKAKATAFFAPVAMLHQSELTSGPIAISLEKFPRDSHLTTFVVAEPV